MIDARLEQDLQRCIPTTALSHKGYYKGKCRNASTARWDAERDKWFYWREKFGQRFVESVQTMEQAQENRLDYFAPIAEAANTEEIPL
jgi:hypothetical protein